MASKYNPPTKSEILITRKCNLKCHYCGMMKKTQEMSSAQWNQVPKKLKELGVQFAPIYGAEPLIVKKSLLPFIKECSRLIIPCSVITNGTLLDDNTVQQLKNAGLTSITLSADLIPGDDSTRTKRNLELVYELADNRIFSDIEVICTVTSDDFHLLPEFVREMDSIGVWVHFDFYHTNKGQQGSKCIGNVMRTSTKEIITKVCTELLVLKKQGTKIHTSESALRYMLAHPNTVRNQAWKCVGGGWITVDCEGSVFGCDDFQPHSFRGKYHILDNWSWDEFVTDWRRELINCPGCFWLTHKMSDDWWIKNESGWKLDITHTQK